MLRTSGAGLAGGLVAVAAAGCGKHSAAPKHRISAAARSANLEILNRALDLEHKVIAAYTAGIPLLARDAQKSAQQFLGQEFAHVSELTGLIKRQQGQPDKAQAVYDLGHPRSHDEVLQLLHDVERAQIGDYLQAIPEVTPGTIRAALGAILGSDAQHIALLRSALGRAPFAGALVTGDD
jgi:hypothetical protein